MIYEFIIEQLKGSGIENELIFPVGANLDGVITPDPELHFAVYTIRSRTPEYDLSMDVHRYREEVLIDFIARRYDRVHRMYDSAERVFVASDPDTWEDEWIHSVECSSPEPDAFDPEFGLYRRTMLLKINWTPV